jgi:uncharacterized protein
MPINLPAKMSVLNKPKIIIAAISSRPYVQSAVNAGFEVLALDAFNDVDTQKLAFESRQLNLSDFGLNAVELLRILDSCELNQFVGFCYGAGFEAQPQLLIEVAKRLPVLGNNVDTLRYCKNPQFFLELCSAFGMRTPQTQFKRPKRTLGWLSKQLGASGGAHIKHLLPLDFPNNIPVYYQEMTQGVPISCLFLADGVHAEVIGYSEQWCSPTTLSPFRYGGAVSQATISHYCKKEITNFIQGISFKLGLRGINSVDFLVDGDMIYALEINPRLSATMELYTAKRGNYFNSHVLGSQAQLSHWPSVSGVSRAHHIIYAKHEIKVPQSIEWPDWVRDIPQPNAIIEAGFPLCTVVAEAKVARIAKDMVFDRAASLSQELMLA